MSEHFDEGTDKKIDCKGKYVSVMIEYGHRHSYINGTFLGETCDHLIVKDNKNKVIYINKNKIICHTFEKS